MIYSKHYTRDEARALLPTVKAWLKEMSALRNKFAELETSLEILRGHGADLGGVEVNAWLRTLDSIREVMERFESRSIQVKDIQRGLIDFPAILHGKEVFLCWEEGEDDISFWHELEAGYAGREPF